jgi:dolichol-phosphate mannosyltransferase
MIIVVLPAYNEEPGIASLLVKIKHTMEMSGYDYRVLVVNDGSSDRTAEEVGQFVADMPIEMVTHSINRGLWETIRDGFERAAEICQPDDVIIRMDADDTHEPEYIPAMVDKLNQGYDVVIASRFQKGGGAEGLQGYRLWVSLAASQVMHFFFPIPGVKEYSCAYRAYRAGLVQDALRLFQNAFIDLRGLGFTVSVEKLVKFRMMGARFAEIPFVLRYDQKLSSSKMLSSITTLGYFVLIAKYAYPWGVTGKRWDEALRAYRSTHGLEGQPGSTPARQVYSYKRILAAMAVAGLVVVSGLSWAISKLVHRGD